MAQYPGTAFWNMVRVELQRLLSLPRHRDCGGRHPQFLRISAVQRIRAGEYYGLILFGTVGMCLMSSAIELVLIFIALEISSISTYVLAGFPAARCFEQRIVAEVLFAGIVRHGVLSLRRRADVRRDWFHEHRRHQPGAALRQCARPVLAYVATALMFVGLGLQGRLCTFSCLDS
jgi:hypothetical protein